MNNQSENGKRINAALESLDGIRKAEPGAWFFARVKARLEREKRSFWEATGSYLARPAIAVFGLLFILGLNAYILLGRDSSESASPAYSIQNSEEELILTASNNTSYDYENIEQ